MAQWGKRAGRRTGLRIALVHLSEDACVMDGPFEPIDTVRVGCPPQCDRSLGVGDILMDDDPRAFSVPTARIQPAQSASVRRLALRIRLFIRGNGSEPLRHDYLGLRNLSMN